MNKVNEKQKIAELQKLLQQLSETIFAISDSHCTQLSNKCWNMLGSALEAIQEFQEKGEK